MIEIKTPQEIRKMRRLGKIASWIMEKLVRFTRLGITTIQISELAENLMREKGVNSAFLGYQGFPSSICVSVNEELIHGIPRQRTLKDGDLVSIDLGICADGFFSDMAYSFCIGKPSLLAKKLLSVGYRALLQGIKAIRPYVYIGDVGWAIQSFVESQGFSVVKKFVGHGIGRRLHEEPEVPNFGEPKEGPKILEGMTLAIEPMITVDSSEVKVLEDNWTVVSSDGKPCVHFEHTVAVTKRGCRILTR